MSLMNPKKNLRNLLHSQFKYHTLPITPFRRNFKWPSMQRQCNSRFTLEILIWSKMWKISSFLWLEKCSILWVSPLLFFINKKCVIHFRREPANENKHLNGTKTLISNSYLIRQSFQGYRCKSGIAMDGHLELR